MRIKLVDIGPIRTADFELTPLTIFVGLNNAGKSFAATVIYATLLSSQILGNNFTEPTELTRRRTIRIPRHNTEALRKYFNHAVEDGTIAEFSKVPPELKNVLAQQIGQELESYGEDVAAALAGRSGRASGVLPRHEMSRKGLSSDLPQVRRRRLDMYIRNGISEAPQTQQSPVRPQHNLVPGFRPDSDGD